MPRIYAPNEDHIIDWGHVDFYNGVAAVSATEDIEFFEDEHKGYVIDNSKHVRTLLDDLTPDQLRQLCGYLGMTIDQGEDPDTKYDLVRAIEGEISSKYLAEVAVSSAAGTEPGTSAITITGVGTYKYKTAKDTAPTAYYMDNVSDWDDIETGDEITPTATHNKIAVAKVNTKGYVLALGIATIAVNPGE